ncbi:rRNA accumulation- protein [Coemansia sp. RSA 720]|nr:rRNA accumulation- protein [Coemansia sp. RSA 720]KAJ2542845.1 rRNA accumulation- protein [Coemansia sp. RSA 1853]
MSGPAEIRPNWAAFISGLDLILDTWESLELAMEQERTGYRMRDKYDKLNDEVFCYFDALVRNRQVSNPSDVENMLVDILDRYFNIMLEDMSEMDVAHDMCRLFDKYNMGNYATVDGMAEEQDLRSGGSAAQQSQTIAQQGADKSGDGSK